ncbi:MAG: Uncharacterised protein [Prochlorococcus marinus str. MIT 9215]|nr:MAG: Uncharacterised protein [Prochlorococcus marinus str. MIT 9215]
MRRNLVTAGFAAALVGMGVAGAHRHTQTQSKCSWVSEPVPDAVIHIQETSPIGIVSADLAWKGKVIRSLLMGQPNGYGSQWWSFKGQDGQPVGGGRLVPFRGNEPSRSRGRNPGERSDAAPKKALLVGLGSSLYYSDFREEGDLSRAGEGFWKLPDHCFFPGRA